MKSLYIRLSLVICIALTAWNLPQAILSTGKSLFVKNGCFTIRLLPDGAEEHKLVLPASSLLRIEISNESSDKLNWNIIFPMSNGPLKFKKQSTCNKINPAQNFKEEVITLFEFECENIGEAQIQWHYQGLKKKGPISTLYIAIIANS